MSPCPAEDLCCLAGWPLPDRGLPIELYYRLFAFGRLPWDRDRAMNVDVAVDPMVPPGDDRYTCTGDDPNGGRDPNNPCNGLFGQHRGRVWSTFMFGMGGTGVQGWMPGIEVDFARPLGPKARVCQASYVDSGGLTCPIRPVDIACATAGTVTLSRIPMSDAEVADVYGSLDVTFDNGFRQGSFTIRLP